jgi:hypothetical protein
MLSLHNIYGTKNQRVSDHNKIGLPTLLVSTADSKPI